MNGLNYPFDNINRKIDIVVKNGVVFGGVNYSAVFKRI